MNKDTVRVDAVLRLLLDKAYTPTGSDDGEQLVNGVWYAPVWGCDTLQYILDEVCSMVAVENHENTHLSKDRILDGDDEASAIFSLEDYTYEGMRAMAFGKSQSDGGPSC